MRNPVFSLFLFLATWACNSDESEKKGDVNCENYFLEIENGTARYFYNNQGLVTQVVNGDQTIYTLEYNGNNKVEMIDAGDFIFYFHYDDEVLTNITKYHPSGGRADSIVLDYDLQGRIIKRDSYSETLDKSLRAQYSGQNTVKLEFWYLNNESEELEKQNTFSYTYDNNPIPYNAEFDLAFHLMSGGPISVNNILSTTIGSEAPLQKSITYNSAGYPTSINGVPFVYSCEPVQFN